LEPFESGSPKNVKLFGRSLQVGKDHDLLSSIEFLFSELKQRYLFLMNQTNLGTYSQSLVDEINEFLEIFSYYVISCLPCFSRATFEMNLQIIPRKIKDIFEALQSSKDKVGKCPKKVMFNLSV